ncbi:TRAP transporter permease [Mailhella sp.]|uniref:TRAP transporter permease n=1 Tax=Mailhella sp. TaxID=1981029 RepID=UPI004063A514
MAKTETAPKKESSPNRRQLSGWQAQLVAVLCIVWASFHLVVASGLILVPPAQLRAVHLGAAMVLCFLLVPGRKGSSLSSVPVMDWILMAIAAGIMGYMYFRYETLIRMGGRTEPQDIYIGLAGMVMLFEAARRTISPGLVALALIALAYVFFGQYLPGDFGHAGFSLRRIVQHIFLSGEGIFGFVLGVSAEIIIVFILFGAVLERVGIANFFNDLANSIAGRSRGGPAKIAVISSALMGMVSGETSANVATTGVFTIPLMKRIGYPPHFAGAVECVASCGGQILPPIMGATAFVIADALGIPYVKLAIAAFLPAVLYFVGVYATVHFRAVALGLTSLSGDEVPRLLPTLKRIYLMLPLAGIVVMLMNDYTPTASAFWGGIVVAVLITMMNKQSRLTLEKIGQLMAAACRTGMTLALACAVVGTIVGTASMTGITMTIADSIFSLAGGMLFPALVLTMIVTIILGMGLPTTAAYVLASISAAPVLLRMGLPELPTHLFVLYYGALSALTPPVCTGAYTAAGLAGASPTKTGLASVRLALSGFLVPFLFLYNQELVLLGDWKSFALFDAFVSAALGLVCISAALEGALFERLSMPVRLILFAAGLLMAIPESLTNYAGYSIAGALCLYYWMKQKKAEKTAH